MPRTLTLACIQFTPSDDVQDNIDRVAERVREAAEQGADVVLPPELFAGYYFCKTQEEQHFARAYPWREHPAVEQLSALAEELGVVIPVSIYEKDGPLYYNSLVMIDADGSPLGVYRKS
ncbi:MAG TPA: N-carbamoylputrescine amidase, partial [Hyphomonas sp.]|nr:N-carbamoylputrescine amidase [Hyphomonas sp.]